MDISFFQSMLYAFVSSVAEFMPVSSAAHEQIMLKLFGTNSVHPLMQLFVHIGVLIALLVSCRNYLRHMDREERLRKIAKRRRKRQPDPQIVMDVAFLKTAGIFLILGFALYYGISKWENRLPISAALLVVNGLILHIPIYFAGGNKDSRCMTRLDALVFGLLSWLGMLPGFSRIGVAASYCALRAADHGQVYKWCLLLSIPAIAVSAIYDIVFTFNAGFSGIGFLFFVQCILVTAAAWLGSMLSIRFMKSIAAKTGLSAFSYYCWGAALFSFILYLYT